MRKLVFASLILSLTISSLVADPDEYEKEGKVFRHTKATFLKVTEESTGKITHKPKESLSLATVEHVTPQAVLHYKYYEKASATNSTKSYWVTTNKHGLTAQSQPTKLPQEVTLAALPVKLIHSSESIPLNFFPEPGMDQIPEYPAAIASAVKMILSEFLPAVKQAGTCPRLKTVTVFGDSASVLAPLAQDAALERIGLFKRTQFTNLPGQNEVTYTLMN